MLRFTRIVGTCFVLGLSPHAVMATGAEVTEEEEVAQAEAAFSEVSEAVRALAGDVASGKKLYRRNCRACHGATAGGAASYPKLVGHSSDFLVDKIARYRDGEKFGSNTPLMAQRVKKLSDQNIADVAAFIVSLSEE